MKKISLYVLALMGIFVAFQACNREKPPTTPVDEEFPTITMTSPIEVPVGQYVNLDTDDSLVIDILFEDDVELDRYEIRIQYARSMYYLKTDNFPWSETYFGDLSGQSGAFNMVQYVVFDPSAGPYTFNVKVWDKAGNMTEKTTYLFVTNLLDTVIPTVNILDPDPVDTFSIGQNIIIRATVSDPDVVTAGYMRVRNPITKELIPGAEIYYDSIWVASTTLDTFIPIPAGTIPGNYRVEVYANDYVYNVGYDSVSIFVRP